MNIPNKAFEYYLLGFRLHGLMTKKSNLQALEMFKRATEEWPEFARAYGHWSYTLLFAWLNDWIASNRPPAELRELADKAVELDSDDYDNLWSKAAVYFYTAKYQKNASQGFQEGLDLFDKGLKTARKQAIDYNRDGLSVDVADALFFAGPNGLRDVNQAIKITQRAIEKLSPEHPKRFLWTLGWAYYERGYFTGKTDDYAQSLGALLQITNPHDMILKNIIASYVALDWIKPARRLAREFLSRNPGYTLAIEDRWPYRDAKRLESWKGHLRKAELPDK